MSHARQTVSKTEVDYNEEKKLECLKDSRHSMKIRGRCSSFGDNQHKNQTSRLSRLGTFDLCDDLYPSSIRCMQQRISNWTFDIFKFDQCTNGHPVYYAAMHLFSFYDLINIFHLDICQLSLFFTCLEQSYHRNNPYHNSIHAADVTQAMHCFLQEPKVSRVITAHDALVTLLAAMCHDVDHPGVSNGFLIVTSNHLASLYHNTSVLENHHWRTALSIIHKCNLFSHFSSQSWHTFHDSFSSLILATDITRQQEFMTVFQACLDAGEDFTDSSKRHLMLQIALKCSDISNVCREWPISSQWSSRVCEEFFKQGDCERVLQLPVTNICDRSIPVSSIQTGFLQFIAQPLFAEWQQFSSTDQSQLLLKNLHINLNRWCSVNSGLTPHSVITSDINELSHPAEDKSVPQNGDMDEKIEITQFRSVLSVPSDSPLRSLSPVSEDIPSELLGSISKRRHSLPLSAFCKEQTRLTIRRESYPRQINRRRSLPRISGLRGAASHDQLIGKLQFLETGPLSSSDTAYTSLDSLFMRPRITSLTCDLETSQLLSQLPFHKLSIESDSSNSFRYDTHSNIGNSSPCSLKRRASLPVLETAREYLTRQLIDVATLAACLDPSSQVYARTLGAMTFYSNGCSTSNSGKRGRSNSMFEMTNGHLSLLASLEQKCMY